MIKEALVERHDDKERLENKSTRLEWKGPEVWISHQVPDKVWKKKNRTFNKVYCLHAT